MKHRGLTLVTLAFFAAVSPPFATACLAAYGYGPAESAPASPDTQESPRNARCEAAPVEPNGAAYGDAIEALKAMSQVTRGYLTRCRCPTKTCVATVLDNYAAAMEAVAPRLQPALRKVPDIVTEAARRVREANSIGAAQAVLRAAIGEVRASIALLRAEDPDVRNIGQGSRDWLSRTLETANVALLKATEL